MRNAQIDENKVERQAEKRQMFHMGLFLHFTIYVVVNVIIWAVWLLIPNKGADFPAVPVIITGAWGVVLIAHALIVGVSHTPRQVANDEIKREVQQEKLEDRKPN